ncbi:flagellar basal body P-ring protein FlgI [Alienimonas californiensis]|uniref:Flagellar P-ring protein n=1 Tax=Alienimonas californiensis TaxID=2527989 RepID=A0A517P404_9PLAN|nr:flagellar basal body P-ring protein FlgI [Alienimonas californiensis]QDT14096.1 Flagellar P-ring protein precursor [Alienimonas californiensis]
MTRVLPIAVLLLVVAAPAGAGVRLEHVCTLEGQKEVRLTGLGLVVGLDGTGDGGKNLPAMRALAAAMRLHDAPVLDPIELKDAANVAVVLIEATVPATGARRGQRLNCFVSSPMGASSLAGGRLLAAPLRLAEVGADVAVGVAAGPIVIQDPFAPLVGALPNGLILEEDFDVSFVGADAAGPFVTLQLDASHAGFGAATEVARAVNREFAFETGAEIALAAGPAAVTVRIPPAYRPDPVRFAALLLAVSLERPDSRPRVVVNARTGTIIVTGEVELSPVAISHKTLTVDVGPPGGRGAANNGFRPLGEPEPQPRPQLESLLQALNQLRVPTADVIHILRELHASGKLHAEFVEGG